MTEQSMTDHSPPSEIEVTAAQEGGRTTVYFDGEPAFTAGAALLRKHADGLRPSAPVRLSADGAARLRETCLTEEYTNRAYYLLSIKDYSEKMLYDRLCRPPRPKDGKRRDELPPDPAIAESVVKTIASRGYVDDGKYACARCARMLAAGESERQIRWQLKLEGIAGELIEDAVAACAPDEASQIERLLSTKYAGKIAACLALESEEERFKESRKLVAALQRKGFSWSQASAQVSRLLGTDEQDADESC